MLKKTVGSLFSLFIAICLLTACNTTTEDALYDSDPPQLGELSAAYYDQLGITEEVRTKALAVVETCQTISGKKLQIRLPEYWDKIYYLEMKTTKPDDRVTIEAIIDLYDKYNYDLLNNEGGLLCSIDVYQTDDFNQNFTPHIPEAYDQIIGANSSIIGTDDQYVYLLTLPISLQFDYEDNLARELYETGTLAKDKIIDDFLLVNDITVNEDAPVLN